MSKIETFPTTTIGAAAAAVVEKARAKMEAQLIVPEDREPRQTATAARALAQVTPAPPSESAAILAMIERAASNPAVDLDKLERLFAMREKIELDTARKAFNAAMADCQKEMPAVARNAENTQTRSHYSTIEAIADAIAPIYTARGFSLSFGEADCPKENHQRVICIVAHEGGHERTYQMDVPIDRAGLKGNDNKTATHAFGSTQTYGRRYLTLNIFNIATKKATPDDDGNGAWAKAAITAEQVAEIDRGLAETKTNLTKFLAIFKIEALADMAAKDLLRAIQIIGERRAAQAGKEAAGA